MQCIYSCSQPKRETMCDSIDSKDAVLLNKLALKHGIKVSVSALTPCSLSQICLPLHGFKIMQL